METPEMSKMCWQFKYINGFCGKTLAHIWNDGNALKIIPKP